MNGRKQLSIHDFEKLEKKRGGDKLRNALSGTYRKYMYLPEYMAPLGRLGPAIFIKLMCLMIEKKELCVTFYKNYNFSN